MTKGDKRRNRRKYRVRYDRIIVLILIIVVIAVLISSCVKGLSGKNDTEDQDSSSSAADTTNAADPTATDAAETPTSENDINTAAPSTVEFTQDDAHKGNLVLVNADHEYNFPENDIDPITLFDNRNDCYQAGDYVTKLDRETITQLNALMSAYAASMNVSTTDIFVLDGYRTFDEQAERHSSGKSKTFEAGHTDYHTGRTFDMFRMDSQSGSGYSYFTADDWFNENAGSYGFILRYPEGKSETTGENPRTYTYRYVGVPHASYINFNKLCLEEYIEEVKGHTNDNPLEITAGGHTYGVYFAAATENGTTAVPVPSDKEYTVSGSNAGGFIVTVTLS